MATSFYKVKAIAISLKNNRVAEAGDVISSEDIAANPDDLVKAGYISKTKAPKGFKEDADKTAKDESSEDADKVEE